MLEVFVEAYVVIVVEVREEISAALLDYAVVEGVNCYVCILRLNWDFF